MSLPRYNTHQSWLCWASQYIRWAYQGTILTSRDYAELVNILDELTKVQTYIYSPVVQTYIHSSDWAGQNTGTNELTKVQTCILTSCDYVELVNILDELTKLKSYTFTSYDNAEQVNILEMYKHNELLNIWMSTFHEPDWGKKKTFLLMLVV
jgi:hypothetical protein